METIEKQNPKLIAKPHWSNLMEMALKGRDKKITAFTRTTVTRFHDRHVGITPQLAVTLVQAIFGDWNNVARNGVWQKVIARLEEELRPPELRQARHVRSGFALKADPIYVVLQLAFPLIAEACRVTGQNWLFCLDSKGPFDSNAYAKYEQSLERALGQLIQNKTVMDLFWKERAHTLASLSRQFEKSEGLPHITSDGFAVLWRLQTRMVDVGSKKEKARQMELPMEHLKTLKQKEDGVDGVHRTRRIQDLQQMLISEHLNPEPIMLDRLLNTGYMALRRPAKRMRRRDVLMVGVLPRELRFGHLDTFLKTCWMEAITRFEAVLTSRGLLKSEYRWIESNKHLHYRSLSFFPSTISSAGPGGEGAGVRHQALVPQGWLPEFFNGDALYLNPLKTSSSKDSRREAFHWLPLAWKSMEDHSSWKGQEEEETGVEDSRFKADRFAHIHIMLFQTVGSNLSLELLSKTFSSLSSGLDLWDHPSVHFSTTLSPETLQTQGWFWASQDREPRPLSLSVDDQLKALAGRLVGVWLAQWHSELNHA